MKQGQFFVSSDKGGSVDWFAFTVPLFFAWCDDRAPNPSNHPVLALFNQQESFFFHLPDETSKIANKANYFLGGTIR